MTVDLNITDFIQLATSSLVNADGRLVRRFVDEWYHQFSDEDKLALYENVKLKLYGRFFVPLPYAKGLDKIFMSRFNPNNQYLVKYKDGETTSKSAYCFRIDGTYFISSIESIPNDIIINVETL